MNVLSLFDGMSCGYLALKRLGINIDNYYASEIDKTAIIVSKQLNPQIIHLGDANSHDCWKLPKIDILFAGFPCQSWSVAGKQLGTSDQRGQLIFQLMDVYTKLKQENPKLIFLFENVKMKQEYLDYLDNFFSCQHIEINSNLVSAQNRKRVYWTNIPNIKQPEDKNIFLKDVVHEYKNENIDLTPYKVSFDKTLQILDKEVTKGKIGYFRKDCQANRIYTIHGKAVTLCGDSGGGAAKMGQYLFGVITPERIEKRQNGQRFNDGTHFYTLTAQDKHGVFIDGYIRKLTPIECGRLQTFSEAEISTVLNSGVSETQMYKMFGNGWTIDVISHILLHIKN